MSGILEKIVADKRARLARGEYARQKPADRPSDGAAFLASLREPGTRIVGEIKAKSPSAGEILPGADGRIENYALFYRRGRGGKTARSFRSFRRLPEGSRRPRATSP